LKSLSVSKLKQELLFSTPQPVPVLERLYIKFIYMKKLFIKQGCLATLVVFLFAIVTGCIKNEPVIEDPESPVGKIPSGFNWKTVKELDCNISVGSVSGISDNALRVIRIYNNSALGNPSLICTGGAKPGSPFIIKLSLGISIPALYIQEVLPNGVTNLHQVEITGSTLNVTLTAASGTSGAANTKSASNSQTSVILKSNAIAQNADPVDNDGDGVFSGSDVDDNDPTVAFYWAFPSLERMGSLAFEDMWPVTGDYDVNDLVLDFRLIGYMNASNMATKLKFDYVLKAAGCTYDLAAAFQMDKLNASDIQSITGQNISGTSPFTVSANGTESGVNLAVIPLFNNQRDIVTYTGFFNTMNGTYISPPRLTVDVVLKAPVSPSVAYFSDFNFFIVPNFRRGCEIHLPTFRGTSKFDATLANGYNLDPNDCFKNSDGMMWGILFWEIFNYPSERSTITSAYTNFSAWAMSGGATNGWWFRSVPENINPDYLYHPGNAPIVNSNTIVFNPNKSYGMVKDNEGNEYKTIMINSREFMAQNLRTRKYSNGDFIGTTIPPNLDISALISPKFQWAYNGDESYTADYGRLYTGAAVTDSRGLCPKGWRVPTANEWIDCIYRYLGQNFSGGDLWNCMKEVGTTHWKRTTDQITNESGLTALPAGYRFGSYFEAMGYYFEWWLLSLNNGSLKATVTGSIGSYPSESFAYSIRCIKGEPLSLSGLTTVEVGNITPSFFVSGGMYGQSFNDLTEYGVCWGKTINPTLANSVYTSTNGGAYRSYDGGFVAQNRNDYTNPNNMVIPGTKYYVRAFVKTSGGVLYGNNVSFTSHNGQKQFNPSLTYGTVKDIENNEYKTIHIGTQTWMAENLQTTKYNNGDPIGTTTTLAEPLPDSNVYKYQWTYFNSPLYANIYGRVYTWHAASDARGICPTGWHLPSNSDWEQLFTFVGENAYYKLSESSNNIWMINNAGDNSSGFTAIPNGFRATAGYFYILERANWWSSNSIDADVANYYQINQWNRSGGYYKNYGIAVRCIKD
jgi:LruC domain-containing protein/uncharacterized protein (TIGR02145 family)